MKQSLAYVVNAFGQAGRVDRRAVRFGNLRLGGVGWIESCSVVVRRDREAIQQFIGLTGHANDGADGWPLAPTMELPF